MCSAGAACVIASAAQVQSQRLKQRCLDLECTWVQRLTICTASTTSTDPQTWPDPAPCPHSCLRALLTSQGRSSREGTWWASYCRSCSSVPLDRGSARNGAGDLFFDHIAAMLVRCRGIHTKGVSILACGQCVAQHGAWHSEGEQGLM